MDHIDSELNSSLKNLQYEYLIEEVFPKNEVHIIGGASGAGKTRWMLDLLLDWEKGLSVLDGKISHPVPWAYVTADRSLASVKRTFRQMGIPWGSINVIPARGRDNKNFRQIIDILAREGCELVLIEMIGKFVDPPGRDYQVEQFLNECSCYMEPSSQFPNGLTIIGSKEEPKQGPRDKYANPRQRISGCAAWGHYSETVIFVDMDHPDDPTDPNRTIYICPREKAITFKAKFDNSGHLKLVKKLK